MSIKIKSVKLDGRLNPTKITLEIGLPELAYLAALTGKQSHDSAEAIAPGINASRVNHGIYATLTDPINRVYDEGVDGALEAVAR